MEGIKLQREYVGENEVRALYGIQYWRIFSRSLITIIQKAWYIKEYIVDDLMLFEISQTWGAIV